jgi:hypothetical protein
VSVGLYDLLAPQFLLGVNFPEQVDRYLRLARVDDLHASDDGIGTVYRGTVVFGPAPDARAHRTPGGGVFRWDDVSVRFRLTVPRAAGGFVAAALAASSSDARRAAVTATLNRFAPTAGVPTDYPSPAFRLELFITALTFHLGSDWRPGRLDPATLRLEPDTAAPSTDVRFVLPQVVLAYEQTDNLAVPPSFALESWGRVGFDAPGDLLAGELVRMEPPIAVHRDGKVGFGVGPVTVDLSPASTPPEILAMFGTDESFTGFLIRNARFFYGDRDSTLSVGVSVRDLLVDFGGVVSFDAELDLIAPTGMDLRLRFFDGPREIPYTSDPSQGGTTRQGRITVPAGTVLQVEVIRGIPPYDIKVTRELNPTNLYGASGMVPLPAGSGGLYSVTVLDGAPVASRQSRQEDVEVTVAPSVTAPPPAGAPADRAPSPAGRPAATATAVSGLPPGYAVTHTPSPDGLIERLEVTGRRPVTVTVDGQPVAVAGSTVEVVVDEGQSRTVVVTWPSTTAGPTTYDLLFDLDKPLEPPLSSGPGAQGFAQRYAVGSPVPTDSQFQATISGLETWVRQVLDSGQPLQLDGDASYERKDRLEADRRLSARRLAVARAVLARLQGQGVPVPASVTAQPPHGFDRAFPAGNAPGPPSWRRVQFSGQARGLAAVQATTTLSRPARTPATPSPTPPGPPPPLQPNRPPSVVQQLAVRVRIERNTLALLEVRLLLDFETELESALRQRLVADGNPGAAGASLDASNDGQVRARLTVTHDRATHNWTEVLFLGADEDDPDGLLKIDNSGGGPAGVLKNALGGVLLLAPVVNSAAAALPAGSAGDWVAVGGVLGAATLGALGIIRTDRIALYGGELRLRQNIPPGQAPASFTGAGIVFDYAVSFGIELPALGIQTTRPLRARYRAIGFDLDFGPGGASYRPIFDTSRGYEIDLSDPGLFRLPPPLSEVLAVAGARIAKVNPTMLEVDLALKVDLGVVTVDRFTVRVPLESPPVPQILPTGLKVNIPSTVIGSGWLRIIAPPAAPAPDQLSSSGFEGGADITIVPVKLRVAADVGIRSLEQGNRKAVAVFLGLVIDFPRPLPLGQTGVGLFSGSALFAMHYYRLEPERSDADVIPPALTWLKRAGGEPQHLRATDGGALWDVAFDRWSFGLGLGLTTMDTLLITLRGMVVLELPGPRILVFIKLSVVQQAKNLPKDGRDLTLGVLGVLDLDFGRGTISLGLLVSFEIESLLVLQVPIELFFNLKNIPDWHAHLGTFKVPASATILGLVRGSGYLQIDGTGITGWPGRPQLAPRTLPGVSIAAGIEASIVLGDEGSGLFAKVAAFADVAASLEPFLLVGVAGIVGQLRLWVVGISVSGALQIEAPDPTWVHGEICGSVDLFFFEVSGCVEFTIGSRPSPPAPPLVSGVSLLSHAPVLVGGQGGDRPIDTSLGTAATVSGDPVPTVPIDSVILVQLIQSPVPGAGMTTFTAPIPATPIQRADGWYDRGEGRSLRYELTSLTLSGPALVNPAGAQVPARWRITPGQTPTSVQTGVDLALLSNVPAHGARALERSTDLTENVKVTWSDVCFPAAPPTCLLWTLCGQRIGPAGGAGWQLTGTALPDPPGTKRSTPVDLELRVGEPPTPSDPLLDALLGQTGAGALDPARVLGPRPDEPPDPPDPDPTDCQVWGPADLGAHPNPLQIAQGTVLVLDHLGQVMPTTRVVAEGAAAVVGLDAGWTTRITLATPADAVQLTVATWAHSVEVTALDAGGTVLASSTSTSTVFQAPEVLTLTAPAIAEVIVRAKQNETLILQVCVTPAHGPRRVLPRQVPGGLAAAGPPVAADPDCLRALQLPRLVGTREAEVEVGEDVTALGSKRDDVTWVTLHTGACQRVRLLLAVEPGAAVTGEWLDGAGTPVQAVDLGTIAVTVTAVVDLPASWLAAPWQADVADGWTFLADPQLAGTDRWLVDLPGAPAGVALRLSHPTTPRAQVVVSVVEACPRAELERHQRDVQVQLDRQQTVRDTLTGSARVPLLAPGAQYTLTVSSTASMRDGDTVSPPAARTQTFQFATDTTPPARLDPYVLATQPDDREDFVLWGDTFRLVFNDLQALDLYAAYGRTLRYELRTADGRLPGSGTSGPLVATPPVVRTPFEEALAKVAASAPCVGTVTAEGHGAWTITDALEPLTAYTLDVLAAPTGATSGGDRVLRRQFTTSRYRDVAALADDVRGRTLRHRLLTSTIGGLSQDVHPDIELQAALVAAGEEPLPPPEGGSLTLYWLPTAAGPAQPYALLVDAAEPVWRSRVAATYETVPGQGDPAFQRAVLASEPAMRVLDASSGLPAALRLVRSTAGTRTLAILPAVSSWTGVVLRLRLDRTAAPLFGSPAQQATLAEVPLDPLAPWEEPP